MKKSFLLVIVLTTLLLQSGCGIFERKYKQNSSAAQDWLSSTGGGSKYSNIEGVYYSDDWGVTVINQEGRNITGLLGNYTISGVVKGRNVYLLIGNRGWVHYTAVVKNTGGTLAGAYSSNIPFSDKDALPLTLYKIEL